MEIETQKALYPIGIVAELLDIHPRTLRIYEQEGLVKPAPVSYTHLTLPTIYSV